MTQRGRSQPDPQQTVFGTGGGPTEIRGHLTCPTCGEDVPFALPEIGRKVACPKCIDVELRAGRSLLDKHQGRDAQVPLDRPFAVLMAPMRRWKYIGAALLTLTVTAGLLAGVCWWASQAFPELAQGWFLWDRVAVLEGELPKGTDDEGATVELPPPQVTLQAIIELESWNDLHKALIQAQVWLQILKDHGINDERVLRLETIIARLEQQLRPRPAPPPEFLLKFRQALKTAREALAEHNIVRAGEALAIAEALLNEHPDELEMYGRSFGALKLRYNQLWRKAKGREKIYEYLGEAERFLIEERATEALEAMSEAKFLSLGTPMDKGQFQKCDERIRALQRRLRFAVGKRAVRDAQRCHDQNDLSARNAQIELALDVLPDHADSLVAGLLEQARGLADREIDAPRDTPLGLSLDFRAAYEEALANHGRREGLVQLVAWSVTAYERMRKAPHLGNAPAEKLARLATNALEFAAFDLLELPDTSEDAPRELAQAREALNLAAPWKQTPKYRYVRQALLSKEDDIASNAIRLAVECEKGGRPEHLTAAIRTIEPALNLGKLETRQRANYLRQQWQKKFNRLTYLHAQRVAWEELSQLSRNRKYLEAWNGLNDFERRFPDSSRKAQIPTIRAKLQPFVDRLVEHHKKQVTDYKKNRRWPEFRDTGTLLLQATLPENQVQELGWIREDLAWLDAKADQLFLQAERHRLMMNDKQVVELLKVLRGVLYYHPDHVAAGEMLKKAEGKAYGFAQGFMVSARKVGPRNLNIYQKYLHRVVALVPEDELGEEAKRLLEEVEARRLD